MGDKRFWTKCQSCDGNGLLEEPSEASGLTITEVDDEWDRCDTCEADGRITCDACDGDGEIEGIGETGATLEECAACDGDGKVKCAACEGEGGSWRCCGECHESFEGERFVLVGDGDVYCRGCCADAFKCAACDGTGEVTRTDAVITTSDGKIHTFPLVGASCSCCAARPHNPGEEDINRHVSGDAWFVARARLTDSDGVFYSYLCSSPEGEGCLRDILDEQDRVEPEQKEKLAVLSELLGDDDDGLWSEMTD